MVWKEKWSLWNSCFKKTLQKKSLCASAVTECLWMEVKERLECWVPLTPYLRQGLVVHCYTCQACWPVSFHGFSYLPSSGALGLQEYAITSSLMKVLRIPTQVLVLHGKLLLICLPSPRAWFLKKLLWSWAHGAFLCASEDKTKPPWGLDSPWSSQELPVMWMIHLV